MTKRKRNSSASPDQTTLFDLLKEANSVEFNHAQGTLDIDTELRAALSEDIRFATFPDGRPMSRHDIAARMSNLVGQEISKSMLDNYTAEAHEKHRFPAQLLPAFVHATGGQRRAFNVLSRHAGLFALPGPEALRAEIQKLRETINQNQLEMKKRLMFLKEVERK